MQYANAAAATMLAAGLALYNSGTIEIRTGTPPTKPEDSATGTLIGTLTFGATAWGTPTNTAGTPAVSTANAITQDSAADNANSGGALYYVAKSSGGTALEHGVCDQPRAFTVTIASPGVFTSNGHGYANGTPVKLATTGALPTGLTAGTTYYVVNTATNTFNLAATVGGSAINTSGTQSGAHTATRQDVDMILANLNINVGQPISITSWTKSMPVLGA